MLKNVQNIYPKVKHTASPIYHVWTHPKSLRTEPGQWPPGLHSQDMPSKTLALSLLQRDFETAPCVTVGRHC